MKQCDRIVQLEEDFLVVLSWNRYYLNVVEREESNFRINSQEKIGYFEIVNLEGVVGGVSNSQGKKNGISGVKSAGKNNNHFLIVFNQFLEWNIFCITKNKAPVKVLYGSISDFDVHKNNYFV